MATLPPFSFACNATEALSGSGPILHCSQCDRDVHDLAAMTAAEASAFLSACRGMSLCVRYTANTTTGELRFRPDLRPDHWRPTSALRKVTLALGLGIGGLAVAQVALRAPTDEPEARPRLGTGGQVSAEVSVNAQDSLRKAIATALADAGRSGLDISDRLDPAHDPFGPEAPGSVDSDDPDPVLRPNDLPAIKAAETRGFQRDTIMGVMSIPHTDFTKLEERLAAPSNLQPAAVDWPAAEKVHTTEPPLKLKVVSGTPRVKGGLTREEVNRVVRLKAAEYRFCYEKQLRLRPGLKGKLTLKLVVGEGGQLLFAQAMDDTVGRASGAVSRTRRGGGSFPRPGATAWS